MSRVGDAVATLVRGTPAQAIAAASIIPTLSESGKASPRNLPNASVAVVYTGALARMGASNVRMFRNWAEHSEWIRAVWNMRKNQITGADWVIGPINPDRPHSQALADQIRGVIEDPNPREGTFDNFVNMVLEDLLTLDAGCFEKERNLKGQIARLWPVDGGTVKIDKFWDGDDPEASRYYWYPDYQLRASWTNDDFVYMMDNLSTYRPTGLSMLETLKNAIDSELGTSAFNDRQMRSAAPDGMLDLGEGARADQVKDFQAFWANEVAGKGAMAIVGGSRGAKWIPFRGSNREMQFFEWQVYLVRKIVAVAGVSMQDVGFTADVNRATGDVQQENTEDRGIRPLMRLFASYMTRHVVQDLAWGGAANNLGFKFTSLNLRESLAAAQVNKIALAGIPWKVVDEARKEAGYPPVGGKLGSMLIAMGPKGPVLIDPDDIPTAREALEAGGKPEPPAGGPPAAKAALEELFAGKES